MLQKFRGRGKEELTQLGAPEGVTFVHSSGFFAAGTSQEAMLALARLALKEANELL